VAAAVISALFASSASAADLTKSGSTLTYQAAAGESNNLTVTHAASTYTFTDNGGGIATATAGGGCTVTDGTPAPVTMTCSDAGVTAVVVNLNDMGDGATAAGVNQAPFTLNGETGNDGLIGSSANDQLDGGAQLDTLFNNPGDDVLIGGTEGDNVNYTANTAGQGIDVTLDGVANDNDGLGGTDNVGTDIELIQGGAGDDTIDASGNGGVNVSLRAFDGNDTVTGSTVGDNDLQGGNGEDEINALGGNDGGLRGDAGNDTINGGDGNEGSIQGGSGNDTMNGDAGNDNLEGQDGNDILDGGAGTDTVGHGTEDTGNDFLRGGTGNDTFGGGPGIDRVLYDDHAAGVTVTIDGVANDGNDTDDTAANPDVPADNVGTTVEAITGSNFNDTLTGRCANVNETFAPIGGDDTVNGDPAGCATPGNDFMGGTGCVAPACTAPSGTANGNDTFNGGGGTDTVTYTHNTGTQGISVDLDGVLDDNDGIGGTDNVQPDIERVTGGAGADTINADFAAVTAGVFLSGLAGDDTLTGSDLNDRIDGGANATAVPGDTIDCQGGTNDKVKNGETVSNCEGNF
jgi:hypothetical protein